MPQIIEKPLQPLSIAFVMRRVDCNDGIASHCATLMRELSDRGHRVILMTGPVTVDGAAAGREQELRHLAQAWVRLDVDGCAMTPSRFVMRLRRALREHDVDVVHTHGVAVLPLVRAAALGLRMPLVTTAHPSRTSTQLSLRRALLLRLARVATARLMLPDRAIAISSDLYRWFVEVLGVAPRDTRLVFNGIDVCSFRPPSHSERDEARRKMRIGDAEFVCAMVGRLDKGKGHDVLLAAADRLAADGRPIRLLIAGGGDVEATIRGLVDEACFAKPHVSLLGYVNDLQSIYWASDVLALPSRHEGFGLVVAEAMLTQVVPIRTPSGGAFDQIDDGVNGFVVPMDDDVAMADRLRWLLENPVERAAMGQAAAAVARQKFSADAMVEKTIAVYREVTEGTAPDPRTLPKTQPTVKDSVAGTAAKA